MALKTQTTVDNLTISAVDTDPSVSGVDAVMSSLALLETGSTEGIWIKTGTVTTNWTKLAIDPTTTAGDLIYNNGTSLTRLAAGSTGQVLSAAGAAAPVWQTISFATPITQGPDNANAIGTQSYTNLCAADHVHNIPAATAISLIVGSTASAEGTSTSFARANHTHNITQNTVEVSATSSTTTTSTTDVVLTTLTTVPAAGTYCVWFSATCSSSATGGINTFSLYNNTTQIAASVRAVQAPNGTLVTAGTPFSVATHSINVVADGTNPISVRWHTNTGTATCYVRTLSLLRIA